MRTIGQIEKEMKALQEELEEARAAGQDRELAIKPLDEFSTREKVKFFDKLYARAKKVLEEYEMHGDFDSDDAQYIFEDAIVILARDQENDNEFWKYWNSIQD